MLVNGCDCSIVIKTAYREFDVPYAEETIREAVSILHEEAGIEGDGVCKAIRKNSGVTGCVVTPLTIGSAPHLLYVAMGYAGNLIFVAETKNLYKYVLNLLPAEDTEQFDVIQDRGRMNNEQLTINNARLLYEGCAVKGFELRVMRGEAVKLKLDICGERAPRVYPYTDRFEKDNGERFNGDFVTYRINGKEYTNIYGITLASKKQGGTKTEIWIKRAVCKQTLNNGDNLPDSIEEMTVTAQLLRDKYEYRHYGMFRITLRRLVLVSDEASVNTSDAVVGPLRFYVAGNVNAEVFESGE